MMTLAARLCALCAMCALMQLALGDTRGAEGLRMIGGLLMLHLVMTGGYALYAQLAQGHDLQRMLEILMQ